MVDMPHASIPEAVAVNMDFFSSGEVYILPGRFTEGLPCSFQFCQTCIRWQMQELPHHKKTCKVHVYKYHSVGTSTVNVVSATITL